MVITDVFRTAVSLGLKIIHVTTVLSICIMYMKIIVLFHPMTELSPWERTGFTTFRGEL